MDSIEFGDILLMFLDDDLFWVGDDSCGSCTNQTPSEQEQ